MANYYVKPNGDDGNDGTTFALAKLTLAGVYALTGVGDTIYVCASEAVPFVDDSLIIAHDRQLTFIGASAVDGTPYTDNTRAVLGKTSGSYIIGASTSTPNVTFKNISFQGISGIDGVYFSGNESMCKIFINCEFKNLRYGVYISSNGTYIPLINFYNCVFDACTNGIYIYQSNTGLNCYCVNCIFKNSTYGIYTNVVDANGDLAGRNTLLVEECRFLSNSNGIYIAVGNLTAYLNKCVFYSNNVSAINIIPTVNKIGVINTIFHSNNYAISAAAACTTGKYNLYIDYNCYYNNTSGDIGANINGGVIPGTNNIEANPLFASTTLGSEDFRLQTESPCLGAGVGYISGQ